MNDITKARFFLKTNGSNLQHLESFGLMIATAEQRYRDISVSKISNHEETFTDKEVKDIVDFAALRYLRKHNQLPDNVSLVFEPSLDKAARLEIARAWSSA